MTAQLVTASERAPAGRDPLYAENVRLAGEVAQLCTALEGAERENAELRRELARGRAENRRVQSLRTSPSWVPAAAEPVDRTEWVRVMLADSHSRNP